MNEIYICKFCKEEILDKLSDSRLVNCMLDEFCFFYKYDNVKERIVEYD